MSSEALEQKIELLKSKLDGEISGDLLNELSALLNDPCVDDRCYDLVSSGVINSLNPNNHSGPVQWDVQSKINCYQQLLNQDKSDSTKHIFLNKIAEYQSTGETWLNPVIAKELEPVIRPLFESHSLDKNAVLGLMLVRENIGDWISQDDISTLHLKFFPTFNTDDMSYPYSSLFQLSVYHKNINDLKHFTNANVDTSSLKLFQLLYISWLFSKERSYPYSQDKLIKAIRANLSTKDKAAYEVELACAKSLLTHHALALKTSHQVQLKELLEEIDSEGKLSTLIDFVANNQRQLQASLNHNETDGLIAKVQKKSSMGTNALRNVIKHFTGVRFSRSKKLKVAICISGQLRGYKQAFESWKKSILVDVDYDIYVHSWINIGGSGAEPFRKFLPFQNDRFQELYREYCLTHGFESMQQEYPTLFKFLKQSNNTTIKEIQDFYNAKSVILDDENTPQFKDFSNSDKMHYKLHACHDLMKESGQQYDLILRIRPDFSVSFSAFNWNDINTICHSEPVIFSDLFYGTNYLSCMVGDQLAISTPEILEVYANTWNTHSEFSKNKLFNCDGLFYGHQSIANNCWLHNITFEKLPIKKNGLLEAGAMTNETLLSAIEIDAKDRNSSWDDKFLSVL